MSALRGAAASKNYRLRLTKGSDSAKILLLKPAMKAAVFFERDGILNRTGVRNNAQVQPLTVEEFHIDDAAVNPLQELKAAGLLLLATTNQPGLSRGNQSRRELDRMHSLLRQRLGLDDIFVCAHDEMDRCPCRKPKPGLLVEAAFKWHLDLQRCFVVSDKWQDAEAAHARGCTSLLIRSPWNGSGHRDATLPDLASAVRKILELHVRNSRSVKAA